MPEPLHPEFKFNKTYRFEIRSADGRPITLTGTVLQTSDKALTIRTTRSEEIVVGWDFFVRATLEDF